MTVDATAMAPDEEFYKVTSASMSILNKKDRISKALSNYTLT